MYFFKWDGLNIATRLASSFDESSIPWPNVGLSLSGLLSSGPLVVTKLSLWPLLLLCCFHGPASSTKLRLMEAWQPVRLNLDEVLGMACLDMTPFCLVYFFFCMMYTNRSRIIDTIVFNLWCLLLFFITRPIHQLILDVSKIRTPNLLLDGKKIY